MPASIVSKDLAEPESIKGHKVSKLLRKLSGQPPSYVNRADYEFGKTMGAGTFGVVRKATKISTGEEVAVKIILKKALEGNDIQLQMLYDELAILQQLKHPNIVEFKAWFESKDKIYIVTQLATGGELFDTILKRGKFTELDAVDIVVQILKAVEYIHSQNVVHRDLKPENILYVDESEKSQIVIADFGIAKRLEGEGDLIFKAAGSLGYVAPEVLLNSGHGKPCDIWSVGIIAYTLLCGYSPFVAEDVDGFLDEIVENEEPIAFHSPYWDEISNEAKQFILRAVTIDPFQRPTATELLKDPWITSKGFKGAERNILPDVKKGFSLRKKLRDAVELVMINNRIRQLKNLYSSPDSESDSDLEEAPMVSLESLTQSLNDLRVNSHKKLVKMTQDQKRLQSTLTQDMFSMIVKTASKNKKFLKGLDPMSSSSKESSSEKGKKK
ncbi:calmodulin-dependent protein kinase CMK2 KNAG_0I01480 [Huiozyma naganishii CBS 8797]|uniref:Protein kinase domain-containing protein n=1 Tax=Huiozyma naganishii (strain ATCC MYA-139 / BCRC 22969 / CBS 8797 / KCTC 17520 / NBRC 10181 / NCYC 3082 / Yp74L-3) TaxID=1071383 RepID=J7SA61_HUIN7|nr:hypothetical protein KNAG_0I01480 [Kazachstania naganishii CBS 8797]CCK71936.1 hypothetical protein KNAG_0I01480 [Kazachstania naganishii CBS 8797]